MAYVHRWFPPFYTRGPFYFFLNTHPEQGLNLVISLMNFVMERWAEPWAEGGKQPPQIEVEFSWGKRTFIGDPYTYYWHRDVGNISRIIPSALMALEKWLYDGFDKQDLKEDTLRRIEGILQKGSSLAFIGLLISVGKKNPELFGGPMLPLLALPEFYSLDVEHILKSEMHQMIGWYQLERSMIKLAQEFHSMPHRKLQLSEIAINLFLSDESTRDAFAKFQQNWKLRFEKSLFETVSPDLLENLIQWFDISNWKTKEDPEHGEILEFEMPKEIRERRKEASKTIQDRQVLIHWPIKFRQILDGEEKLSPDDGEKLWSAIQFVNNVELPKDDPDFDVLSKENAICGGVAVLFKYFKDWLRQRPDKEKWCIGKVTGLILNPPPEKEFDSDVSIANWFWNRFCAEAMPIIWADDPENQLYRRCMAILTINKHYETVTLLFRSASELRVILKEHFRQLINFLLRWSHARWRYTREQCAEKKSFDLNKWLGEEIEAFEKGKVSSQQITWELIAQDEIERRKTLYEKEIRKRAGKCEPPKEAYFDLWLMKAAFNWMPPLDQAVDKNERKEWLVFWRQALAWTLNILETDENGEISGAPSDWDGWLFERIAIHVMCMDESEKPAELWNPILALGGEGHYWVENFLMEWFIKGIGAEKVPTNFIKRWKEMIEYAFGSEKWNPPSGWKRFHLKDLWCELLGMNYIISALWKEDKKSIIKEMKGYYERWAKGNLADPQSAVKFIFLLMCSAADEILHDGLVWLDKASDEAGNRFFTDRHENVQNPLANLLEITWKKHRESIKENNATFEAFKSLLRKLVDLQNLQAIEIQQNLI